MFYPRHVGGASLLAKRISALPTLIFSMIETFEFATGTLFLQKPDTRFWARSGISGRRKVATRWIQASEELCLVWLNQSVAEGMVALPGIEPGFED
jgi:hypothetical protein